MANLNQKDVESLIDQKLERVDQLIDERINKRLSLSIKYWYPTLIAIILATAGAVWWFKNQIQPIENDVIRLKSISASKPVDPRSPVVTIEFLTGLSLDSQFSEESTRKMQGLLYKLTERRDLVAIVAGYTSDKLSLDEQKLKSEQIAEKIAKYFLSHGIERDRVFFKGHSSEVPSDFDKSLSINSCVMLCDVFTLMKQHVSI